MQCLDLLFTTKRVVYYGVDLEIPADIKYLATDKNGVVWGYVCEPWCSPGHGYWINSDFDLTQYRIAKVALGGIDWCTTCKRVE